MPVPAAWPPLFASVVLMSTMPGFTFAAIASTSRLLVGAGAFGGDRSGSVPFDEPEPDPPEPPELPVPDPPEPPEPPKGFATVGGVVAGADATEDDDFGLPCTAMATKPPPAADTRTSTTNSAPSATARSRRAGGRGAEGGVQAGPPPGGPATGGSGGTGGQWGRASVADVVAAPCGVYPSGK